ncbi:hypothetical protein GHT06_021832 [Daphnia sinensis]|uniref:Uncharacterized protein n=1 Tax=Daphnia sinensis TaxID=1820382 RepID=A0AAD5KGP8_9CRUS|nr:hypothetical protein GHT06_021832 [Daphnia sinensis]
MDPITQDREKYMLTRTLVDELASVMKLKSSLPDSTLMILVHFILQDAGGTLPPHCLLMDDTDNSTNNVKVSSADGSTGSGSIGAFDCIRPHFNDIMDFLADVHTLSKLKSNSRAMSPGPGLDEDTLGGTVKAGMAQLLALEIVRGNGKDNKCLQRYMPWLLNPPSSIQQGPREFLECVCHVRLLSWLLGALQHTALVIDTHSNGPLSMPREYKLLLKSYLCYPFTKTKQEAAICPDYHTGNLIHSPRYSSSRDLINSPLQFRTM